MREIKFRVWDKELKEAYIEKLQDLCEDNYWYDGETEIWSVLADCNDEQERFVALQYTGLKDKNGKEIYEGDILKFSDEDTAIVKWDEKYGYFMVKPIQDYHFDSDVLGHVMKYNEVKVIGNIYNNPDLLEGQEINIQSIKEIKEVFIENSTSGEDVKFLAKKYNNLVQAIKQLDNKIKEK